MNQATFTRAGTGPRPFTVAVSEQHDMLGIFDLELGALRFGIRINRDSDDIEEFTDYEAAKARFAELTTKG